MLWKHRNLKCIPIWVKVAPQTISTTRTQCDKIKSQGQMRQMVQLQMGSSVVCLGVVPSNTARFNDTLLFVTVLGPSSLQGVEGSILPLHGRRDVTVKWSLDQDGRSPCWAISYYSSLCRREVVGVRPGDTGLRRTTGGSLGFPNPKSSNNEMKKVTVTIPTLTQACRGVKTHRGGSWQCHRWQGDLSSSVYQ